MKTIALRQVAGALIASLVLFACESGPEDELFDEDAFVEEAESVAYAGDVAAATAELTEKNASGVRGQIWFIDFGDQTLALAFVTNLGDNGAHGLHVHEQASCDKPGPHHQPAADPGAMEFNGNVAFGRVGVFILREARDHVNVGKGGDEDVLGHSVVVHDDVIPAGQMNPPPVACGVIEVL